MNKVALLLFVSLAVVYSLPLNYAETPFERASSNLMKSMTNLAANLLKERNLHETDAVALDDELRALQTGIRTHPRYEQPGRRDKYNFEVVAPSPRLPSNEDDYQRRLAAEAEKRKNLQPIAKGKMSAEFLQAQQMRQQLKDYMKRFETEPEIRVVDDKDVSSTSFAKVSEPEPKSDLDISLEVKNAFGKFRSLKPNTDKEATLPKSSSSTKIDVTPIVNEEVAVEETIEEPVEEVVEETVEAEPVPEVEVVETEAEVVPEATKSSAPKAADSKPAPEVKPVDSKSSAPKAADSKPAPEVKEEAEVVEKAEVVEEAEVIEDAAPITEETTEEVVEEKTPEKAATTEDEPEDFVEETTNEPAEDEENVYEAAIQEVV